MATTDEYFEGLGITTIEEKLFQGNFEGLEITERDPIVRLTLEEQ